MNEEATNEEGQKIPLWQQLLLLAVFLAGGGLAWWLL
jgi:hypothetical protein